MGRYAVFIQHLREDERKYASIERVSFETAVQNIEDDPEVGLYWIFCFLKSKATPSSANTQRLFSDILVKRTSNKATRHIRDYIVLVGFQKFLDRAVVELDKYRLNGDI